MRSTPRTLPSRYGKSLHVSALFPAWFLGRTPTTDVILASYAAPLAERWSRRARGFVASPRYPFADVRLSAEAAAAERWDTRDGGGVLAEGVRGGITGWRADLLVVDDPVKDRAEADSPVIREATWEWWQDVALAPRRGVRLRLSRPRD
jgi:hypothetical protein